MQLSATEGTGETGVLPGSCSLAHGEDSELQAGVGHREAHGGRIVARRQRHLAEGFRGGVFHQHRTRPDVEIPLLHREGQQRAGLRARHSGDIQAGRRTAGDRDRGAAQHHIGDAQTHTTTDHEGGRRRGEVHLGCGEARLSPIQNSSGAGGDFVQLEHQPGTDDLHHVHPLQLRLTQGSLQAGELPGNRQRLVAAAVGRHRSGREHPQVQTATRHREPDRCRIIAGGQGHGSELGLCRIDVEPSPGSNEERGFGDCDGEQITLQRLSSRNIRIINPADHRAAEVDRCAAKHHVGDGQAHTAADTEGRIARSQRDGGIRQNRLGPIEHFAAGHRGTVHVEPQRRADQLERIDALQLGLTERGLNPGVLAHNAL